MAKPLVAIVGRPNVGKSSLFNRLSGRRTAVTDEEPGTTRDRLYADCEWRGRPFTVVDTGGLDWGDEPLTAAVRQQIEFAIDQAQVLLFVVDSKDGLAGLDFEIAQRLRKTGKPVLLIANKAESVARIEQVQEFPSLGLGAPIPVSALHGMGVGELLDALLPHLPEVSAEKEEEQMRVAIVGRPNVGKSVLVNALAGEERSVVSHLPGTTRDAIDTPCEWRERKLVLVDTAGLKRQSRVKRAVEYYSMLRALGAIERCHVAVLVVDGHEGISDQDKRIGGYAHEQGKGQIILANKWDLVEDTLRKASKAQREFDQQSRRELHFLDYAPMVFASGLKRWGLERLMDMTIAVADQHSRLIGAAELASVVRRALEDNPLSLKGRRVKIYQASQVAAQPPTFVLFVNDPALVHFSHLRYLGNRLRQAFNLDITPIRLLVRKSEAKRREA
jgi:GTP-binding protein